MKEWEVETMYIATNFRRKCVQWLVRRPAFTFSLMLIGSLIILPALMVAAISPVALILDYLGVFISSDDVTIYNVLFNGFLLSVIITAVITIIFLVITCTSIIHSHKSFLINKPKKNS